MSNIKLLISRNKKNKESQETLQSLLTTIIGEVEIQMRDSSCFIMNLSTGIGKSTDFIYELYRHFQNHKVICSQVTIINTIGISKFLSTSKPDLVMGTNIGYQASTGKIIPSQFHSIMYQTLKLTTTRYLIELQKGTLRNPNNYIIVIDEAHTNDVNSQEQLAIVRDLLLTKKREELPFFIIQSASIDVNQYMNYFKLDSYILAEGSRYPVKRLFLDDFNMKKETNFIKATVAVVDQIIQSSYLTPKSTETIISKALNELKITKPSSILIFISKQKQMTDLEKALKMSKTVQQAGLEFVLINSPNIEKDSQLISRADNDTPKIFISTNVIETGYTINNLSFIIDGIKFKSLYRNPISKVEIIREVPIDKQMQQQRKGRVGRTQPGIYIGVCPFDVSEKLVPKRELQIQTANLQQVIAQFGIMQFLKLEFMSQIPNEHFIDFLQIQALVGESNFTNNKQNIIQQLLFSGIYFRDFRQIILIILLMNQGIRVLDIICLMSALMNVQRFQPNRSQQVNDFEQLLSMMYDGKVISREISNQVNQMIILFKTHGFNIYTGDPLLTKQGMKEFARCLALVYHIFMFERKSEKSFTSKQGITINIDLPVKTQYFVCMNVEYTQDYTCKHLIEIGVNEWNIIKCK